VDAQSPDHSLSWAQIKDLVCKAAVGFRAIGVEKGDCVIFLCENSIQFYPLVYGCVAAGAIPSGLPATGTTNDLRNSALTADAKYFIVEPKCLDRALEILHEMSLHESNIIIMDPSSQDKEFRCDRGTFKTWISLLQHEAGDWERLDDLETARKTVGMRFFTSGTLGTPKAVDVSHYGLVAHVAQWYNLFNSLQYDVSYDLGSCDSIPELNLTSRLKLSTTHRYPISRGFPWSQ
jgi:4-coumarate--CoA ligase